MELQSIDIPLLARDRAPGSFLMIDVCMRNTIMITPRYRKAINDGDGFAMKLFPRLP
jgi:hypothetical protein